MSHNPLLDQPGLPAFSQIKPEHVEPAIDALLAKGRQVTQQVIEAHQQQAPSWDSFMLPLELVDDEIERAWSPVSHLNSVVNTPELRQAYDACLPKLSEYGTEMGQNADLYRLTKALTESPDYDKLSQAQKKTLEHSLRSFKLSGIDLPPAEQQRYKEISQRLSELNSKFEQNLLDATNAWSKHISDEADLAGLPESAMAMAQQAAESEEKAGWLLNLQIPCYLAVMTYADNRQLREEMYRAYNTRASDLSKPEWDNSDIIEETLALRHEAAQLLGFANYAERSLATKMAKDPREVMDFLNELADKSHAAALKEVEELRAYAAANGCDDMQAWDVPYYSEKLQHERYEVNQEMLKPWFPAPKVIQGLFDIVGKLYGLQIQVVEGDIDRWHPDVTFYEIRDENDELRGQFYLDLYARQNKRGGAWMDVCISRFRKPDGLQYPVAYLTCNATPPIGDKPALLTHDEVITLFHEFGHGLHHMLTKVDVPGVSGISGVEWDAVELPSQFMENWCWEREALDLFARHWQTDEPLPDDLYQKMLAAKNYHSAMMMVRQLEFSLFDFRLHLEYQPEQGARTQQILDEVRRQVAVITPPDFNRFQHGFSHIFAGGYAAGYYSYKWAEVLSADAFSAFEENGIFDRVTGEAFLSHVLERGGSEDAMELFVKFRGRKPSIDPLLKHSGLAA